MKFIMACIAVAILSLSGVDGFCQVVTSENIKVEIAPTNISPVKIAKLDMPPMKCSMATFKISTNNKIASPIKATVFSELVFMKDSKGAEASKSSQEIWSALSFHNIEIPPGASAVTVVFSTLNYELKGEGKLKVYLVERIAPTPPPPRMWFLDAGGEVALLSKPFGQVYQQLSLQQISNTIVLPSKTTD